MNLLDQLDLESNQMHALIKLQENLLHHLIEPLDHQEMDHQFK